ncbi:MAG: dihydroorotate dehydrogenase-like protein [Chloroflexi bacterium]|nr:dihydroorotate dehydrogenase-like protein [Chloroflexota bacterium]
MNLKTNYLGLELENPLVPSASPLSRTMDGLRKMEDAGASAVVLYSLFEEQILHESHTLNEHLIQGSESFAEALSYFPESPAYLYEPEVYFNHIHRAKEALSIPIIGSLNGVSTGWWIHYAKNIEQAGADALELNIYYLPTNLDESSAEIEDLYLDALREVKTAVSIPVAMKLSPYFSAVGNMAKRLVAQGADGLVLFNRFYQPDLDLKELAVVPNLPLSNSLALRLPLRWIAIIYGHIEADLALTSGVHSASDVLKGIAAGAAVTMVASELLQNGIGRITDFLDGVEKWLDRNEYESLDHLRGSLSQINCAQPAAFERANYMRVLDSYSKRRI